MTGRWTAAVLSLLLAATVRLPASEHLPLAVAGALAAPLAASVAGQMAGARAAAWAGGLVAVSPIHTLASREADPEVLLVLSLLLALMLLQALERERRRGLAISLGLVLAIVAAAAILGLARSPLDYGEIAPGVPVTTVERLVRCTGASLTRVIGIEYQLAVAQARDVLPLTALFVALMLRGALRLPARSRGLLVAGALLPVLLGATMAVSSGCVLPLQATRLVAALPFVAVLMAAGLASLSETRAWALGTLVGGSLVAFLAMALAR